MSNRSRRIDSHSVLAPRPGQDVTFSFNGAPIVAREGEVIAAALIAQGITCFGQTERRRSPRGIYCAIGHCFSCLVNVDGRSGVRACLTRVRAGMTVESRGYTNAADRELQ